MSYINKKSRLFTESSDVPTAKKRYDGKMKSYDSAIDARAWCDDCEDRRQYILDLLKQREEGKSFALGKFIPIEVIIDILLASKNAEIKKLQDLLDMYSKLNLTPEQLNQLDNMKRLAAAVVKDIPPEGRVEHEDLEKGERELIEQEKEDRDDETTSGSVGESLTTDEELTSDDTYGTPFSAGELNEEFSEESPIIHSGKIIDGYEIDSIVDEDDIIRSMVDKDTIINELKKALEEQNQIALAAIQQLEAIEDIVDDLDSNRRQTLQSDSCKTEIEALEHEIEEMKRNQPTGQGVDIVQKELVILKKYCSQLSEMQNRRSRSDDLPPSFDDNTQINLLKEKIKQLEKELATYKGRRSQLEEDGDEVNEETNDEYEEQNDLQIRLDNLKDLNNKVAELKKKVKDCENEYRRNSLNADAELQNIRGKCDESDNQILCLENEIDQLKSNICCLTNEKKCLKSRLDELSCIQEEFQDLLDKTKDFEKIKCNAKKYKKKYDELIGLQCECENMKCKLCNLEKERENLTEEIKHMECCMQSQNDEIQKLVCHIKCLTDGRDQQQNKMKETLCQMRKEMEKKDEIITDAQLKLSELQEQLCTSIDDVSSETSCLCKRIEELEEQLHTSKTILLDKDNKINSLCTEIQNKEKSKEDNECKLIQQYKKQITELCEENKKIPKLIEKNKKLQEELEKAMNAFKADKHLRTILKQSKCAIEKVTETIGKRLLDGKEKIGDQVDKKDKDDDTSSSSQGNNENKKDNEIGNLRKRVSELENKISKLEDGLAKADGVITNLKSKSSNLEDELKIAHQHKKVLEESMHSLLPQADEIHELKKHSSRIQDLAKEQLSKYQAESQAEIIKVQTESQAQLSKAQAECQVQLSKLQAESQAQISKLQSESKAQLLELKAINEQLKSENDKLSKDMKDLQKQLKDLQGEKDRLEQLVNENKSGGNDMERLQMDLDNERKIAQDLRDEIAKLKAAAAIPTVDQSITNERDGLLKQIDDQKREINDLLNKIKQLSSGTATNDECGKLLDAERTEKENLKKLVGDLENQLKTIRAKKYSKVIEPPKADDNLEKIKSLENELAKQKQDCSDTIAKLQEQYERDIKNIKKENRTSIIKLQNDQENDMKNIAAGHEQEVEGLKKELKASKIKLKTVIKEKGKLKEQVNKKMLSPILSVQTLTDKEPIEDIYVRKESEDASKPKDVPKSKDTSKPRSKSVDSGKESDKTKRESKKSVDSGTVKDKEPIHESRSRSLDSGKDKLLPKTNVQDSCMCSKFPDVIAIPTIPSDKRVQNVPQLRSLSRQPAQQHGMFDQNIVEKVANTAMNKYISNKGDNDKEILMKRLNDVEDKLLMRLQETQAQADELQLKVDELKKELNFERYRNSDLKDKTICQSKVVATMKDEINKIKVESVKDKQQIKQFNSLLQEEQARYKQLEMQLQREREKLINDQNRARLHSTNHSSSRQNSAQPFYTELRRRDDVECGCNHGIRRRI